MTYDELVAELAASRAREAALLRQVEHLTRMVERLSAHFGVVIEPPPPETPGTDTAAASVPEVAPSPPAVAAAKPGRRGGHGRNPIPDHLPVDEHVLRPSQCGNCGGTALREVGTEVSRKLDYVPSYIRVRQLVRHTCACRACGAFVTSTLPPTAIDKGLCTAAFLAYVAHSKYTLHLPLERLRGELRRQGVDVSMSTMCGWIESVAFLLAPLVRRMREILLARGVVQTDGTGLQVLRRGQPKAHFGQVAVYCDPTVAVFVYTPTKEGKHAAAFLDGYTGVLVADASSTFDQLYANGKILEAGCWAHARRKFEEALDHAPAAHEAVAFIAGLYAVEHDVRDRGEDLAVARRERTVPQLAMFRTWLDDQAEQQLPKSPMGKAVAYARRHWTALTRFASDARLPLDNNLSERQLRSVAVGRSNYIFAGSDAGAEHAAVLYSVVQTCKLNEVDPYTYLADVLDQLAVHPSNRRRGGSGIDELLPWRWEPSGEQ